MAGRLCVCVPKVYLICVPSKTKAQRPKSNTLACLGWHLCVCGLIVGGGASVGTTISISSSNGRGIGDSLKFFVFIKFLNNWCDIIECLLPQRPAMHVFIFGKNGQVRKTLILTFKFLKEEKVASLKQQWWTGPLENRDFVGVSQPLFNEKPVI